MFTSLQYESCSYSLWINSLWTGLQKSTVQTHKNHCFFQLYSIQTYQLFTYANNEIFITNGDTIFWTKYITYVEIVLICRSSHMLWSVACYPINNKWSNVHALYLMILFSHCKMFCLYTFHHNSVVDVQVVQSLFEDPRVLSP